MSFFAYLLRCADGSYYAGHTDNLEHRVGLHQSGQVEGYTQSRCPVELVWSQDFPSRIEALEAERRIKGWSRAKKEALIAGDWEALHQAAIPPGERESRALALRLRSGRTEKGEDATDPSQSTRVEQRRSVAALANPSKPVRAERSRSTATDVTLARQDALPVIVLVRPQLGENIGKAARAMLNFRLTEMRLVSPRDGWPNPAAGPAAAGADMVLARARVFESVADAVADCAHVYATTVRKRGVTKPVETPEVAARAIRASPGRSAILFGPERSGLETDDVALARTIITVPINPDFGSLNLAQAVILVAYEWSKHAPSGAEGGEALAQPPETPLPLPAPQEELDGMIAQLDMMLVAAHFYYPPDKTPVTRRTLRTLLTKPAWSREEVRTLRGVLSALAGSKRAKGQSGDT